MQDARNLVGMGRVAGAWGIRGWIRVDPWTREPETLCLHPTWWLDGVEIRIATCRLHSGSIVAKVAGIDQRDAAQEMKGRTVALPRDALPAPVSGSYYWSDLVGLCVVNQTGEKLGVVKEVLENGAHEILRLDGERERLVPWVPEYVESVELADRRIRVRWNTDW